MPPPRIVAAVSDDELSDDQFHKIAALVEQHAGIRLPPVKKTMLEGRLRRRARALALPTVREYCEGVLAGSMVPEEFVHLINAMTTNKTDFFREPDHFVFLRDEAVPRLLEGHGMRPLRIWSAAASIGAEAYTIAMVLAELRLARYPDLSFRILGTDISTEVLRQAALAVYPAEMMVPVPPRMRQRHVMSARDPASQSVRMVPELRRLVRFQRLNLMDSCYHVEQNQDVIFCRNVLIYFDRPTQQAVLSRLCRHLRPGGYLILGHSESAASSGHRQLRMVAPTIFLLS